MARLGHMPVTADGGEGQLLHDLACHEGPWGLAVGGQLSGSAEGVAECTEAVVWVCGPVRGGWLGRRPCLSHTPHAPRRASCRPSCSLRAPFPAPPGAPDGAALGASAARICRGPILSSSPTCICRRSWGVWDPVSCRGRGRVWGPWVTPVLSGPGGPRLAPAFGSQGCLKQPRLHHLLAPGLVQDIPRSPST